MTFRLTFIDLIYKLVNHVIVAKSKGKRVINVLLIKKTVDFISMNTMEVL